MPDFNKGVRKDDHQENHEGMHENPCKSEAIRILIHRHSHDG